ncbi:hypothetical protein DH2020_011292 [Rehmannia glutinosa]|uniref:BHLH domain-containing protein n=1 Tax=Rehmannia glutinosa TaxID=99300 RepID=A0ABR0XD31_REHGL
MPSICLGQQSTWQVGCVFSDHTFIEREDVDLIQLGIPLVGPSLSKPTNNKQPRGRNCGMDNCLPDWNTEVGVEFPLPIQKKPLGLENDLVELLWQNGEVVLHSQNNRKQSKQQVHKHDQSPTNPNNLIQDDETISWIDCPIDESFEKEFYANFSSSELPSFNPVETNKLEKRLDFAPLPLPPPPRFDAFDTSHDQNQNSIGFGKTDDLHSPVKKQAMNRTKQVPVTECSVRTIGTSHCASNQVANETDMSWASKVSPPYESTEKETVGQAITSCSGGSGSSFWNQSNDHTNGHKRKSRDVEESECRSDATELESAAGNKTSQKSGTTRRSRVAEVHNLSERRRRDRINEKMRALQELIPHSNKSDKASMLDEAIEYMKSLQLQLQKLRHNALKHSLGTEKQIVFYVLPADVDGKWNGSDDASGHAALHVPFRNGNRTTNASSDPKSHASITVATR